MPKIQYIEKNFRPGSLEVVDNANVIILEYAAQGFILTLRQLYYQFVARDLIPNSQKEYKRIGSIINDARLAGLIDWSSIEDRTRNLQSNSHWKSPADIIKSAANSFKIDKWSDQENYIEVWIEKEALIGVIEPVCQEFDVPFFACRGYTSQSEQWRAGRRMAQVIDSGRDPIIFHLGDHDPSGLDMTRDNKDRLDIFAGLDGVEVKRLALNFDQVQAYSPPPNPAKQTDSRFSDYQALHGDESWELDALNPEVIGNLIRENIELYLDKDLWNGAKALEANQKDLLRSAADNWDEIAKGLDEEE